MQLFSTVSLLLLASSSFTVQALKDQQQHSSLRREQDQFRRRGKKGGSNGGNASPGNVQGDSGAPARTRDGSAAQIDEPGPAGTCISFNDEIIAASIASSAESQSDLHDEICNVEDNACGSADSPGCCRYHTNLLVCDTSNDFRQQACICNDYTSVPAAIVQIETPSPTPAPTKESRVEPTEGGNDIAIIETCEGYETHPYQEFADKFDYTTCVAGDQCDNGSCCVVHMCLCEPLSETFLKKTDTTENCLSGFDV